VLHGRQEYEIILKPYFSARRIHCCISMAALNSRRLSTATLWSTVPIQRERIDVFPLQQWFRERATMFTLYVRRLSYLKCSGVDRSA